MRERPIIFSGPMVRALLAGTKTQTRRLSGLEVINAAPGRYRFLGVVSGPGDQHYAFHDDQSGAQTLVRCRTGQPGDRLWVKETWRTAKSLDAKSPTTIGSMCIDAGYKKPWAPLAFEADGHRNSAWRGFNMGGDAEPGKTRVSIHMPRWASRITLDVTAVRVERLQDISDDDAVAEGIIPHIRGGWHWHPHDPTNLDDWHQLGFRTARDAYFELWASINGRDSLAANPWVWVIEFPKAAT